METENKTTLNFLTGSNLHHYGYKPAAMQLNQPSNPAPVSSWWWTLIEVAPLGSSSTNVSPNGWIHE